MLSAVVDTIKAELQATLKAAGAKVPSFGFGVTDANKFKAPPSIVIVPVSETITKARAAGTDDDDLPALWDRRVECVARIYESDIDACDALAAAFMVAMEKSLTRVSHGVLGADWNTEGVTNNGQIKDLKIWLGIPVTGEAPTTVRPTSAPITPVIHAQV